ncbi:DUF4065 domain-containing protein [Pseudoduganella sp. FT26W]|uniref:DUF4065 domain-containing protein n=1 Tax=Duganella aquatilis TaxID=2666082 RepID=A0A844D840_9BURK|nr:Panacea domain-containing protein [Duganella aquatilis]MRW83034.1 DUF4065 domain-containing protein [Duganella aquatilis]
MLIDHEREKLINAIIFFAKNTHQLGKIKLYKLLYLLDFEHFRDTGRSVTGLQYFAWPKGPVPVELHNEVDAPKGDLADKVAMESYAWAGGNGLTITPKAEFDSSFFSKRELRLLDRLASEFRTTLSKDMIERTHLENEPWDKVFNVQGRRQQQIPYELAARAQEVDEIRKISAERSEIKNNFANV